MRANLTPRIPSLAALALLLALGAMACSFGVSAIRMANTAANEGRWDDAVVHYAKAVGANPSDPRLKLKLQRARINASRIHMEKAKRYQRAELLQQAAAEYEQAAMLDLTNQFALDELEKILHILNEQETARQAGMTIEDLKKAVSQINPTPVLDPQANIPIAIKFEDQDMRDVFKAITTPAGINVLFDESIREKKITVNLQDITFLQAMDILTLQTGTFYKVINSHTIILAPENRQKHQEYDDQVIRTFYLSNADVKDVFALLRSLIDARNVAQNEQLNAITIKDTPEKVLIAERIIRANDKAKGEVVIDVELLEINKSNTLNFGPELSNYSLIDSLDIIDSNEVGGDAPAGSTGSTVRLSELGLLKRSYNWAFGIPAVTFHMLKTMSNAQTIAHPQIRVTEGEKGSVHIGDQVPIPTTTFNQNALGSGGIITPITNFTYTNVGTQIQLEARVHHNREVTLKVKVEVSSITSFNSAGQPTIGTRQIETVIRLKDGHTNILAGLIRDEERDALTGLPGLSDLPIVRRLFGSTSRQKSQTDIILSLTPHIIRMPNITAEDLKPMWVGSGDRMRLIENPEPIILSGKGEKVDKEEFRDTKSPVKTEARKPEASEEARPAPTDKSEALPEESPAVPAEEAAPLTPELIGLSTVNITPKTQTLEVGREGTFTINASEVRGMAQASIRLSFNPKLISVSEVTEGGILGQNDNKTSFLSDINNAKGLVTIGYAQIKANGVSGSGVLARFKVKALKDGLARLNLAQTKIRDTQNHVIGSSLMPGMIQIKAAPKAAPKTP